MRERTPTPDSQPQPHLLPALHDEELDGESTGLLSQAQLGAARRPLQRKASVDGESRPPRGTDGNGVAADADGLIANAESSSGHALPGHLQRKFETSLGASLEGVRVHTGGASQEAAASVSAKAYTTGRDIHFAAGQYDPGTAEGERLLAHEVAHTVQQSGAAAHAPQYKLEVSTPGDHHELEADHAAEAMMRGERATVSASSGVARDIDRPHYGDERDHNKKLDIFVDVDWNTLAPPVVDVPADPPTTAKIPRTRPTTTSTSLDSYDWREFVQMRRETWDALDAVARKIEGTWESMAPAVLAFNHARDEIHDGGALGPMPIGENWNAVPKGAERYDQAAGEQSVGKSTKVKDLFHDKSGDTNHLTGVDDKTIKAARTEDVSKAFEQAHFADNQVQIANKAYIDHFNVMQAAANDVKRAGNDIRIGAATDEKDKGVGDKALLEEKKRQAAELMNDGLKWLAKVGVMLVLPEEAFIEKGIEVAKEVGKEVAGWAGNVVASKISAGTIDAQIAEADARIMAATAQIRALTSENLALALDTATRRYQSLHSQIQQKRNDVQLALSKRHDAYHHAAQAAGGKAAKSGGKQGAEQGERIGAAIEAIPKVQTVVGRIHDALDRIVIQIPGGGGDDLWAKYEVGYSLKRPGEFDVRALAVHNAMLKSYRVIFEGYKGEWEAKARSLDELTKKLNVPGT